MLSKIYLFLTFLILTVTAFFLVIKIQKTQQLNKDLEILKKQKLLKDFSHKNSFKIANLYFKKGMNNEALLEYTKCLENWGEDDRLGLVFLLNRIVIIYSKLKEYNIALYYCKRAINTAPSSIESLINLNRLFIAIEESKTSTIVNF